MKKHLWSMLAWASFSAALSAQENAGPGTLPPVEVRPNPPLQTQPLPPVEVRPTPPTELQPPSTTVDVDPPAFADPTGDFPLDEGLDTAFNDGGAYPSLSDQGFGYAPNDFGGLNGLAREEKSLFEMAQHGSVVDRRTLDERMSSNMFRALQQETGVLLQQTGNGQLAPFIRGLTGQQILILVDGVRMNNSVLRSGPNQYAATIDPGSIDHIEVIRGAQSAMWGSDALGGAINIVTRSANSGISDYRGGSVRQYVATADDSSYSRGNVEGWWGNSGVFAGASYLGVQPVDIGGGLGPQPGTDYDQYAADIKYNYVVNENNILTAAFQHFEQLNLPRSDRFLPFVAQPRPDGGTSTQRPTFFDQQRDLAYLRLQGLAYNENMFVDAYSATVSYSLTKEGQTEFRYANNGAIVPNRREDGEFNDDMLGLQVSAVKDLGDFGKVTYGADYYYEDVDSYRGRAVDPTAPNPVYNPVDSQYPNDAVADRMGTFLMWDVNLTQRLNATASVRYENLDSSGTPLIDGTATHFARNYSDFIASTGLSYEVTEEFRLVGGVYEGFRAPTIDDLASTKTTQQNTQTQPGNFGIDPEHSYTYEAGFKVNTDRWRIQCYEWWTDFDSYIGRGTFVDVNGANTEFLVNQQAYLNGTEASAEYLLDGGWSVWGNGAYTYGYITTNGQPVSRIPPLQGWLGLRWRDSQLPRYFEVYTWMVDQVDQKHYNQFNLSDVRFVAGGTPGYATLNVRAGTALGQNRNHKVSIGLENITDKYYRVLGSGVDGPGFNALVGYEFVW